MTAVTETEALALREFFCPFCGADHNSPNGTGGDIQCCGEVGHCETRQEHEDRCEREWLRHMERYAT